MASFIKCSGKARPQTARAPRSECKCISETEIEKIRLSSKCKCRCIKDEHIEK